MSIIDVATAQITITVSYHEARALRSAALAEARKKTRAATKGFIPERGRIDQNIERARTLEAAAAKVDAALTAGIAANKEAAHGTQA